MITVVVHLVDSSSLLLLSARLASPSIAQTSTTITTSFPPPHLHTSSYSIFTYHCLVLMTVLTFSEYQTPLLAP